MIAILFAICLYSSDAISSKLLEYLVFHNRDISIKLSLLQWSFSIDLFQYLIIETSAWSYMSELKMMDLVYFIFLFIFYLFIFLYFLLLTKDKEDLGGKIAQQKRLLSIYIMPISNLLEIMGSIPQQFFVLGNCMKRLEY